MTDLIPRQSLFGNPHRAHVQISPDGSWLSWLADDEGTMNVWVAPRTDISQARVVTHDRSTGIASYFWGYTNRHILFLQDRNGDEDFHLYSVDLDSDQTIDLTPFQEISAQLNHRSHRRPTEVLVGINDRDQHWFHDMYLINIETGERELVVQNDQFIGFLADDDLCIRFALALTPESEMLVFQVDESAEGGWSEFQRIPSEEMMTTAPVSLNADASRLYMLDSRDRDTAALTEVELATGAAKLLFASDLADVGGLLIHPTENRVQAVCYTWDRLKFEVLDPELKPDFEALANVCDGELEIVSQTTDQSLWIVCFSTDDGPVRYYQFDRSSRDAEFLFSSRPELDELPLAKMNAVVIESRDGLKLVSYLTLPGNSTGGGTGVDARPDQPLPMVLLVHGGPWWRDHWGFHPEHQLLANRGYAVLSVNFRGSTGFGKSFINAANGQWAGQMHDDLVDAVQWAIGEGIADEDRIAIMGGSYGGYAALVGLTITPELFACGIDIVGPSNLVTLMQNPPPYWMPILPMMTERVGDVSTDEGREFLESRSPLFHVDQIQRPLLIGQGANDPRVKQAESDQIVAAMKEKNIPVTYVLYPEEGHGFDRPENDISFYAICEAFLAEHLGGQFQPVVDDFAGANFDVLSGVDQVPGLQQSIAS